jgi:hypothetical protein
MQVDPKANLFESVYASMGNNPLRYIDPLGDTVKWADDDATNALRERINTMRGESKILDRLMANLESSENVVQIGVNDKAVDEVAESMGYNDEDKNKVGGFTTEDGKEIVFRAEVSDKGLVEEPFHTFQTWMYKGSRTRSGIEAEAKLFDFDVISQINISRGIPVGGILTMDEIGVIDVSISQESTGDKKILENTPNQRAYYNHLNIFSNWHNNNKGPYKGKLHMQLPNAYNKLNE